MLEVMKADTFWKRLKGLMFKDELLEDTALLITPCNSVHSFFMKFDIDLIFLDKNGQIVKLTENMRPNRLGVMCLGASSVLECRAGFISENGITEDHKIQYANGGSLTATFIK